MPQEGSGGTEHLGAAITRAQHVQALDVAVHDCYQRVVQVGEGARRLARCPDALICGRRRVLAQDIVPAAARHPLHDDEGIGRFQAGAEYLHAVRVVDLREMSAGDKKIRRRERRVDSVTACLAHSRHFPLEIIQVARVESDFDSRAFHGGLGAVVERPQYNA